MLSLTILGDVMFQFIKIIRKCAFILIKFAHGAAPMCETRFLRLEHLHEVCESCPIKVIFTRSLTFYNSSEHINWALFSKAKTLRSPSRRVSFYSFNTSKGFPVNSTINPSLLWWIIPEIIKFTQDRTSSWVTYRFSKNPSLLFDNFNKRLNT